MGQEGTSQSKTEVAKSRGRIGTFWHLLWRRESGIPLEIWNMVSTTLKSADMETQLDDSERQAATSAYYKDEASRHNRMGSTLVGVGAAIGVFAGGISVNFATDGPVGVFALYGGLFYFVFAAVGHGVKLYGAQKDGVGVMVAAVIDKREADKAAQADSSGDKSENQSD